MEPMYTAGGSPRPVPAAGEASAPWFQTPYGDWRLKAEVEAMEERFPGFRLAAVEGSLGWMGRLARPFGVDGAYLVQVRYPMCFPDEPPEVTILEPELVPDTPHLVLGRRPCLYLPTREPSHGYDPATTTAATLVAWTALWIHAYETWAATGLWPGRSD